MLDKFLTATNLKNSPTVNRPIILHPATDVWITGIVSDNSDSKTL